MTVIQRTGPVIGRAKAVRETIATAPSFYLTVGGLLLGAMLGFVLRQTNYCMMGAISDWRLGGDRSRLGAVALAAAVAIVATQALDWHGVVDTSKAIYLTPRLNWAGAIGGGLLFGFGMVYAGGCPSRALARAGGGDLRALVAMLVMSIAAFAALSGIFGPARVALDRATGIDLASSGFAESSLSALLSANGLGEVASRLMAAALVAVPLFIFAFRNAGPRDLAGGFGVGILVAAGWCLTGLGYDEMSANPLSPASFSFVKPVADAFDWLGRSTAIGFAGFAAASVFGVAVGAFVAATMNGTLRLSGFADKSDLVRHIGGAAAMGVGGIVAMGCTIGQGVSGISTLSLQSLIAVPAIMAGAVLALNRMSRTLEAG